MYAICINEDIINKELKDLTKIRVLNGRVYEYNTEKIPFMSTLSYNVNIWEGSKIKGRDEINKVVKFPLFIFEKGFKIIGDFDKLKEWLGE